MQKYPYIQQFINKHHIALENNAKDVRFTIQELNNIVKDITLLSLSIQETHKSDSELVELVKELVTLIKTQEDYTF